MNNSMLQPGDKVYSLHGELVYVLGRRQDGTYLGRAEDGRTVLLTDAAQVIEILYPEDDVDGHDTSNDTAIEEFLTGRRSLRGDGT